MGIIFNIPLNDTIQSLKLLTGFEEIHVSHTGEMICELVLYYCKRSPFEMYNFPTIIHSDLCAVKFYDALFECKTVTLLLNWEFYCENGVV